MNEVKINPIIEKKLAGDRALASLIKLYLLALYFKIDTKSFGPLTVKRAVRLGIYEHKQDLIVWNIPLFAGTTDVAFDWVSEWMDGFKNINPNRKGTKAACVSRMKKFFSENPEVRVDDVFAATQLYFKTVDNPTYLKSSHKFIYEGTGFNLVSMLLQYVEMVREHGTVDGRTSKVK